MSRIWLAFLLITACGGDDGAPDGSGETDAGGGDAAARCASATQCDDGSFCNGAERCDPADPSADALGCVRGSDPCDDSERCDEGADECLVGCAIDDDLDGDGVPALACGGEDCDDTDPDVNPSAPEICDVADVDEDCDPSTFGTRDADEDGAIDAACCNGDRCGTDCDDTRGSVRPGATEACNARDDDCDGSVDEGLSVATYGRDCDRDGFAAAAGTVSACAVPPGFPECGGLDGAWTTTLGDCDDTLASRNPGNPEVCNGVDDDCNDLVDDITSGTVVCTSGSTGACTNACGVAGTSACAVDCLGFDACSSTSSELCNYCDDDGDGLADDRALAIRDTNETTSCGVDDFATYGSATCETSFTGVGGAFDLEAVLLPGTSTSEAGALWMTPASWAVGYGTVEVEVELQVRVRPAGGDAEMPIGSWAIVIAHSGTPGVGSGAGSGIPSGVDGVAARWFWSRLDTCYGGAPEDGDGLRAERIGPSNARIRLVEENGDFGCFSSWRLNGGQAGLGSGTTTTQRQRMRVRYTPDDPSTPADEETLVIFAESPAGSGDSTTFTYRATDAVTPRLNGELAAGQRLMVGITAGTHTTSAMGFTFGVPVEAKARVWRFTPPDGPGEPTYSDFDVHVRRNELCP